MSTSQDLKTFIQSLLKTLDHSYDEIDGKTAAVLKYSTKLSKEDKIHLSWGLTHLHTSLCEYERDLQRHIKILDKDTDAG